MSKELKCDICGSTDDVQAIELKHGLCRNQYYAGRRNWCKECRRGGGAHFRYADPAKRRKR